MQRAWVAGQTGYNAETLRDSVWDAANLALVVAGAKTLGIKSVEDLKFTSMLAARTSGMTTAEKARYHLLASRPGSAASKLTAEDLAKIYPEGGALPDEILDFAKFAEFEKVARANPQQVRLLLDAQGVKYPEHLGTPLSDVAGIFTEKAQRWPRGTVNTPELQLKTLSESVAEAAQKWQAIHRRVAAHPADSRFLIVSRAPETPNTYPEIEIRVSPALDHNGAFQRAAPQQTATGISYTRSSTNLPDLSAPLPEQLVVNGRPLKSLDRVAMFSNHGSSFGFAGLSSDDAAKLVARQIKENRAAGKEIDFLVLDACHQRDLRWFLGGSHAQAFQKRVNQLLAVDGGKPLTVLAAENPGVTYSGFLQKTGGTYQSASYVEADHGAKFIVSDEQVASAAIAVGATGIGGALTYRAVAE